jgi:actin-related protein
MLKRLFIISVCVSIGIFFSSLAFSQDDPSTTDPNKIENATDEGKTEVKDETKKEEVKKAEPAKIETEKKGEQTVIAANAKAYTDGKTIFVNSKVQFKLTATDDLAMDKI